MDQLSSKYGVSKRQVMKQVGMSPSVYYYRPTSGRKGCLPSTQTWHHTHGWMDNQVVVKEIEAILSRPFHDYWGYHNVTAELKETGYHINHKKVYRLMKKARLLKPATCLRPTGVVRKFVKFRKVATTRPLECIEMDIKCVWIPEQGKQAYLLTLLDIHTRHTLAHRLGWNMKKDDVIRIYASLVDQGQLPEGAIIRSDNGSQFLAHKVREYLKMVGLEQEFTQVATPEENGHVEAYHGILKKELFNRFEYRTYRQASQLIDEFVEYYNTKRRHGSLKRKTPQQQWEQDQHLITPRKNVA